MSNTARVVLVTFVGPRQTIDAAANAEVPLRELLGPVQELLGLEVATAGAGSVVVRLLPAGDGARSRMSELTSSLADLGAVDGDLLTFAPRQTPVNPTWAAGAPLTSASPAPASPAPASPAPASPAPAGVAPAGPAPARPVSTPTMPPAPTGPAPQTS
jgi:hypothetical protein